MSLRSKIKSFFSKKEKKTVKEVSAPSLDPVKSIDYVDKSGKGTGAVVVSGPTVFNKPGKSGGKVRYSSFGGGSQTAEEQTTATPPQEEVPQKSIGPYTPLAKPKRQGFFDKFKQSVYERSLTPFQETKVTGTQTPWSFRTYGRGTVSTDKYPNINDYTLSEQKTIYDIGAGIPLAYAGKPTSIQTQMLAEERAKPIIADYQLRLDKQVELERSKGFSEEYIKGTQRGFEIELNEKLQSNEFRDAVLGDYNAKIAGRGGQVYTYNPARFALNIGKGVALTGATIASPNVAIATGAYGLYESSDLIRQGMRTGNKLTTGIGIGTGVLSAGLIGSGRKQILTSIRNERINTLLTSKSTGKAQPFNLKDYTLTYEVSKQQVGPARAVRLTQTKVFNTEGGKSSYFVSKSGGYGYVVDPFPERGLLYKFKIPTTTVSGRVIPQGEGVTSVTKSSLTRTGKGQGYTIEVVGARGKVTEFPSVTLSGKKQDLSFTGTSKVKTSASSFAYQFNRGYTKAGLNPTRKTVGSNVNAVTLVYKSKGVGNNYVEVPKSSSYGTSATVLSQINTPRVINIQLPKVLTTKTITPANIPIQILSTRSKSYGGVTMTLPTVENLAYTPKTTGSFSTVTAQIPKTTTRKSKGSRGGVIPIIAPTTLVNERTTTSQALGNLQTQTLGIKTKSRTRGRLRYGGGNTAPSIPFGGTGSGLGSGGFYLPTPKLSPDFGRLSYRGIGKRSQKKGYTPSFSALLFNIRGQKTKGVETGINFRPVLFSSRRRKKKRKRLF